MDPLLTLFPYSVQELQYIIRYNTGFVSERTFNIYYTIAKIDIIRPGYLHLKPTTASYGIFDCKKTRVTQNVRINIILDI